MFGLGAWSNRRKAVAAAALALLLWLPSGISTTSGPLVTGHSTFYNGTGFDPCLASIVGVMKTDVLWFNDMVLVERYGGRGTFVYISENGSEDPRSQEFLFSDGVSYEFTDPNGATWSVQELWWTKNIGHAHTDPGTKGNSLPEANSVHESDKYYVWVVELSSQPIYDLYAPTDKNDPNYHTVYNFVALVDTCKFHKDHRVDWSTDVDWANNPNGRRLNEDGDLDYTVEHNTSSPNYSTGHRSTDETHTHEAFLANVYIGKQPLVVRNTNVNQLHPMWEDGWAGVGVG